MERNEAAARHSRARQLAWLLLSFFPFPLWQFIYAHCTQWCKFLSQEVRENRAFFVLSPREFPLSVCDTFTRDFQIIRRFQAQPASSRLIFGLGRLSLANGPKSIPAIFTKAPEIKLRDAPSLILYRRNGGRRRC